ncbi:hypothetical protein, partial [Agrobacterium cavarae]
TAMPSSSSVPFTARKNAPENSSQKWSSLKGSDHPYKKQRSGLSRNGKLPNLRSWQNFRGSNTIQCEEPKVIYCERERQRELSVGLHFAACLRASLSSRLQKAVRKGDAKRLTYKAILPMTVTRCARKTFISRSLRQFHSYEVGWQKVNNHMLALTPHSF